MQLATIFKDTQPIQNSTTLVSVSSTNLENNRELYVNYSIARERVRVRERGREKERGRRGGGRESTQTASDRQCVAIPNTSRLVQHYSSSDYTTVSFAVVNSPLSTTSCYGRYM